MLVGANIQYDECALLTATAKIGNLELKLMSRVLNVMGGNEIFDLRKDTREEVDDAGQYGR